jgi:hypothetical protein
LWVERCVTHRFAMISSAYIERVFAIIFCESNTRLFRHICAVLEQHVVGDTSPIAAKCVVCIFFIFIGQIISADWNIYFFLCCYLFFFLKYSAVYIGYTQLLFLLTENLGDIHIITALGVLIKNCSIKNFVPTWQQYFFRYSITSVCHRLCFMNLIFIVLQSDGPINDAVHERMLYSSLTIWHHQCNFLYE